MVGDPTRFSQPSNIPSLPGVWFKVKFIAALYPLALSTPTTEAAKPYLDLSLILFWNGSPVDPCLSGGKVGEVLPPHLVMPITAEPSKPRMCHEERFLNLWIKDLPFSLDLIIGLPRYIHKGNLQTTCDDKSGYDHVCLSTESRTYFGLEWSGWFFVFNTLPFGWKASAYLYHSIGVVATSYIRSHGVPCSQYIDDRHFEQLQIRRNAPPCSWSDFQGTRAALYIACYIFIDLGYFIGVKKSTLVPTQAPTILGYIVDC